MSAHVDIPVETLGGIHQGLLIDEEWTVWGDRSCSWVGHRLLVLTRVRPTDSGPGLGRPPWPGGGTVAVGS